MVSGSVYSVAKFTDRCSLQRGLREQETQNIRPSMSGLHSSSLRSFLKFRGRTHHCFLPERTGLRTRCSSSLRRLKMEIQQMVLLLFSQDRILAGNKRCAIEMSRLFFRVRVLNPSLHAVAGHLHSRNSALQLAKCGEWIIRADQVASDLVADPCGQSLTRGSQHHFHLDSYRGRTRAVHVRVAPCISKLYLLGMVRIWLIGTNLVWTLGRDYEVRWCSLLRFRSTHHMTTLSLRSVSMWQMRAANSGDLLASSGT